MFSDSSKNIYPSGFSKVILPQLFEQRWVRVRSSSKIRGGNHAGPPSGSASPAGNLVKFSFRADVTRSSGFLLCAYEL